MLLQYFMSLRTVALSNSSIRTLQCACAIVVIFQVQVILTDNNQTLDSTALQKRMKMCGKKCTKACLHQLIVSVFDYKPIN